MVISDFFESADEVETLLIDARFFARRAQDLRLVDDVAGRYLGEGMGAQVTESQVRHLKKIAGLVIVAAHHSYMPPSQPRAWTENNPPPNAGTVKGATLRADGSLEAVFEPRAESDPLGIDQHAPGAKLDSGKQLAGVLLDFSRALEAVADVGTFGANKYTRGGWQSVPEGEQRYMDALMRHLLKMQREDIDPDSGLAHLAHLAWNCLAVLELRLREAKA